MRLVGDDGEMMGVVTRDFALKEADSKGLDLVEVSGRTDPPICRIIDYGKFLYDLKKKEKDAKKSTKSTEIKGIRLTFRIGVGDFERQRDLAENFLKEGHPVRIQLVMRGREKAHSDLAIGKVNSFIQALESVSRVDQPPKINGFQVIAVLKPGK